MAMALIIMLGGLFYIQYGIAKIDRDVGRMRKRFQMASEKFDVVVKNRFTGKVAEVHNDVSLNKVFSIEDWYFFEFWIEVIVMKVEGN